MRATVRMRPASPAAAVCLAAALAGGCASPQMKGTPFFSGSDGITAPVLDSSGNIYVGSGNKLYAFRPNLSQISNYPYTLPYGNRASKPVIGPDGTLVVSYINFEHIHCIVTPHYSNIRTIGSFKDS